MWDDGARQVWNDDGPTSAQKSAAETGWMSSVETGQMSAVVTGQMSAAETGQMSAVPESSGLPSACGASKVAPAGV